MHQILNQDLQKMSFPGDFAEDEEPRTCRCTSFGEAASAISCTRLDLFEMATFFRCFYNGIIPEKTIWFPYYGAKEFYERTIKFEFENIETEPSSLKNLEEAIKLGILLVISSVDRNHQLSYEFYYPAMASCQFGFGQLLVQLFFTDLVKPREIVTSGLV